MGKKKWRLHKARSGKQLKNLIEKQLLKKHQRQVQRHTREESITVNAGPVSVSVCNPGEGSVRLLKGLRVLIFGILVTLLLVLALLAWALPLLSDFRKHRPG